MSVGRNGTRLVAAALLLASAVCVPGFALAQDDSAPSYWQQLRDTGRDIKRYLKERARPSPPSPPSPSLDNSGRALRDNTGPRTRSSARIDEPRLLAPRITRVAVGKRLSATVGGSATPGSRIELTSQGRIVGRARVPQDGRWVALLNRSLSPGINRIYVSALKNGGDPVSGADVRILIPQGWTGEFSVTGEASLRNSDPVRDQAEALAHGAGKAFSELVAPKGPRAPAPGRRLAQKDADQDRSGGEGVTGEEGSGVVHWLERSARRYQDDVIKNLSDTAPEGPRPQIEISPPPARPQMAMRIEDQVLWLRERAGDWLAKSKRGYQDEVARKLSAPAPGSSQKTTARRADEEWAKGPDRRGDEPSRAAERDQQKRARDTQAEEQRWQDQDQLQQEESQRAASEAARKLEEEKRLQEAKRAEDLRRRNEAAARQLEADRLAEQARRERKKRLAEDERTTAQERPLAGAERPAWDIPDLRAEDDAQRAAEAVKKQQDAQRLKEAKRAQDLRRRNEDAAKRAEADRLAADDNRQKAGRLKEEQRAKQEQARRAVAEAKEQAAEKRRNDERQIAEELRRKKVQQRAEDQRRQEELQAKKNEAKRLADEAKKEEAKRLTEEAARKDAERKRLAEEARAAATGREASGQRVDPLEEKQAEELFAQEMEAEQLAADVERRSDEAMEGRLAERSEKSPLKRDKRRDMRPAEGSAEGDEEDAAEVSESHSAQSAVAPRESRKVCRKRSRRVKGGRMHVVQPGETLWAIAQRYYGSGKRYNIIYRANKRRISDPDLIVDCHRIYVPLRKRRR